MTGEDTDKPGFAKSGAEGVRVPPLDEGSDKRCSDRQGWRFWLLPCAPSAVVWILWAILSAVAIITAFALR